MPRSPSRRIFHWPLFCVLAAVHLLVFPLLFAERENDVVAIVAGLFYVVLAVADVWQNQRPVRT